MYYQIDIISCIYIQIYHSFEIICIDLLYGHPVLHLRRPISMACAVVSLRLTCVWANGSWVANPSEWSWRRPSPFVEGFLAKDDPWGWLKGNGKTWENHWKQLLDPSMCKRNGENVERMKELVLNTVYIQRNILRCCAISCQAIQSM